MNFATTSIYWHLPILLTVFSVVYSATRHDRWDRILLEAIGWAVRVSTFLAGIGVVLYVLSTYPDSWPYLLAAGAVFMVAYFVLPMVTKKKT